MRFYYFMMRRYDQSWKQLKCFVLYIAVFTGLYFIAGYLKISLPFAFYLLLLFLGWLTATFIEYIIHRFWMHSHKNKKEPSAFASIHQYHHSHPSEIKISGVVRIVLLVGGIAFLYLCFYLQSSFTFLAGLYLGFCSYTLMHKAIHQTWAQKIFPKLTRFHIYHHCKFPNTCFGVTVTWWDEIFRTGPPKTASISPRIKEFYFEKHHH